MPGVAVSPAPGGMGPGAKQKSGQGSPVWSSGVAFYPPSSKYWRIGGKWYDFAEFLDQHPGGREVLELARDRFEDCTFVFEAHHLNYRRARAVIAKYEVDAAVAEKSLIRKPRDGESGPPQLLDDKSFYSVLRQRVHQHLVKVGHPGGGPTSGCIAFFWATFAAWAALGFATWWTGSFFVSIAYGVAAAWLGAFGHNWVHQTKYKFWAYLSLDVIGFSSDGWFREHNMQHHMYTNTPWDNHFKGTDPFLVTDPTVPRNWLQRCVLPYANWIILSFGLFGNYIAHFTEVVKGNEKITVWKLCLPLQLVAFVARWGLWGALLMYVWAGTLGVYYFSMALMNHNAEHCMDVTARNKSRDWGEAQLHSSADWGVDGNFYVSMKYLCLNYHTVHHMFPRVDFSHHQAVQGILMETCSEFGVEYRTGTPWEIYKEMVGSFASPRALLQEIVIYAGGI
mmetsp:Transcript_84195/g.191973  ORF Transcript_84195/g.191973 Transcript_84195/m.191973 type:complete len:451 (-) Transcript_84195:41-1393(-)